MNALMFALNAEAATSTIENLFTNVPEITLPSGIVVPAFQVGTYLCSKGDDGQPIVVADRKPWVSISYHDAMNVLANSADLHPLTGTQSLAIAWDIINQDENWTGGKIGEGSVYMGIHKWNVSSAQAGDYESEDPEERRWHVLSNGERIYDFSGNAFSWIFDDLHGDPETGIVNRVMPADSPYLDTAPYSSMEKGMGWRPDGERDWSGYALVRGGYWGSGGYAGVFRLGGGWPDVDDSYVGFRCTKSVSGA
jgi:hypothetical protein